MFILFDIGGTSTRFALSKDRTSLEGEPVKIPTPQNYKEAISAYAEAVKSLIGNGSAFAAAGGFAGPLTKEKDSILASPNLSDWVGKPLKKDLSDAFGCSVYLENDAALGGLGEAVFGSGKGHPIVAYLTISTGIGGSRIVNEEVDVNALGFEPGHQYVDISRSYFKDFPKELIPSFENYASGSSIERRTGKKASEIHDLGFFEEEARLLAYGINNVIVFWSPDIVVLGGGVVISSDLSVEKIQENLIDVLKIFPGRIPKIKKAALGDNSGLFGALALINGARK